jgi:tRNA-dihydrouridine synthase 1
MAPMVAASDYPFRYFLRKHCGVDLAYTQMLHSRNFCNDAKFRRHHLDLYDAGATYGELMPSQVEFLGKENPLPEIKHERAPLMVQLAGHDPGMVVKAALMIMDHTGGQVTGFDLNCGCPQGIARRGRYGAFLMEEDDRLVCTILSALREALPSSIAVSAKIRLPLDDETLQDRIPRLVGTGITFMTVHGRTLLENKTKVGAVHTNRIRLAIEAAHRVDKNFPVVANGGMETYRDVQEILAATGAVAAMSSEALLETPNIFMPESIDVEPKARLEQQFAFARDYLNICATIAPPVPGVLGASRYKGGSFTVAKGHILKFLHRYFQEHTDIRDRMADDPRLCTVTHALTLVEELYERYADLTGDELSKLKSSSSEASWYRRHRKPGRWVHQKDVLLGSGVHPVEEISIDERKRRTKERIQILRMQNQERAESNANRFTA